MKLKLLAFVLLFNSVFVFSQEKIENTNTGKRIKIKNVTEELIHILQNSGIDLRCGAVYNDNGLKLELTSQELENLKKAGVSFDVEIDDLTKFYAERAIRDLPKAEALLKAEKAKNNIVNNQDIKSKSSNSITNTIIDSYLQYYGEDEVDWPTPSNFDYGSMGGCLTVQETLNDLDAMRVAYPNLITVKTDASPTNQKTYGFAGTGGWAGQTVYYVKISDGISSSTGIDVNDPNEPDILYTSMIHSRELSSLMGNIYFMWFLLENYATNSAVKHLVDNNELFFVPIVNPDGLKWNEKEDPTGGGMNRTNLRGYSTSDPTNNSNYIENYGVDPNRNFDYLWGSAGDASGSSSNYWWSTYRGPSAFSEPESQIMRDFILARNFKTAVWMHSYANGIPHPYGGIPTKISGREDEMAKWHEDMTRYNRYVYGAQVLSPANGIADDWMLGGTADSNGSVGSGMNILATTPENGADDSSEGGFWPSIADIIPIAKRMVRISLMNAYYGGKYAKFHDLTQSDITSTTPNLTFGIEKVGQTTSDFTITVTPISSNILSVGSPVTESGMTILEQRNSTIQLNLEPTITADEKIEYKVSLSNNDGVIYEANFVKYYSPSVLFSDDPDTDLSTANWVESTNWVNSNISAWSGSRAIKAGASVPYANNINNTLTTTNSYDLSGSNEIIVQFYAKWDLERNFDFVELLGSADNGSSWVRLNGKYNKPEASSFTNGARSSYSSDKNSYLNSQAASSGLVYDGNQMDNWVMEEIVINAANNSSLLNASNAKFRFRFVTDGNNIGEVNYSTTYEGFYLDDFKIIKSVCTSASVPTNLVANAITNSGANLDWDNIALVNYDIRYKETSSSTWIDILDISTNNNVLSGLSASTEYEVQVRSKCDASTTSAYTSSTTFTTLAAPPCVGTVFSDFATGYSESFESGLGDWTNATDDDIEWTVDSNGTPSTSTGPSSAFDGTWYLYTEASDASGSFPQGNPNKLAVLISPCFDLTGYKDAQFTFNYHWFGANISEASLTVEVSSNNGTSYTNLFTKLTGEASSSSWQNSGILDLSAYNGETIKIKISGITGDGFGSDMAIDNFSLTASVDTSLGIQDELLSEFVLYPNPVKNGQLKLNIPREITDFNVAISNVLGQTVFEQKINDNYNTAHTVNTSNLKQGIYFVTVSTNLGMATKKMIIQ